MEVTPGAVIPNWDKPVEPYVCNGHVTDSQNGDNPNLSFDVSLPSEGDARVKSGSGSNPVPGKTGA